MPDFSVVIPLYNKEKHIKRAIDSVLNQTAGSYEIVVVDDGSTDNSADVVEAIKDDRIRLIRQKNSGVSAARNRGIEEARNEFVAFLDSDDSWKPDFFENILRLMEQYPSAGAYALAIESYDGKRYARVPYINLPEPPWEGIIPHFFKCMLGNPPVFSSSVVIRAEVFKTIGGFKIGDKIGEDVEMWCRIALNYPIAFSHRIGAVYHLDAENRTYVIGKKFKKPIRYIETLETALRNKELPVELAKDIKNLIERIELGHASAAILSGDSAEGRKTLKGYPFDYYKRQKLFWYAVSFLPARSLLALMDLKAALRRLKNG
ncbi:MAG: glycosyltransferase [Clostridia bacterium]|nr:glycosyltransferase [Clostridia bacterium]